MELASTLTACSTTATDAFKNLTPGTYSYSIGTVGNATALVKVGSAWAVTSTGTVSNARSVTVPVRFGYRVTFTESGLNSTHGFSWSVTSQGQTATSSNSTIELYLTNGSDGFTVHMVSGYRMSSSPTGRVVVVGAATGVAVAFTPK